ncbi:DASH complex subunit ask1 [Agyrium rufum]|nr:DASH complex subunit ask1 [Agyrium rufum]
MSRHSTAPSRNLTLTEELEKLEQSITLTLQGLLQLTFANCGHKLRGCLEIDHNFSKAHRIVTSSILPIVEKYAEHSKDVWEGSKFWKQFFEASANVSLSGYEEKPIDETTVVTEDTTTQATPSSASYASPSREDYSTSFTPTAKSRAPQDDDTSYASASHTTPKAKSAPRIAAYSSPYEALKREMRGQAEPVDDVSASEMPSTPREQTASDLTPQSSPFLPPSAAPQRTPANDVLLHRMLDKNYRLMATPMAQSPLPKPGTRATQTPMTSRRTVSKYQSGLDDLDSSPLDAPQLRPEIFGTLGQTRRVPGVSVLTPARQKPRKEEEKEKVKETEQGNEWDSDEDEDESMLTGMSPPKTMQFHIPQSKLLKTPGMIYLPSPDQLYNSICVLINLDTKAREASKRIIEDLLFTAGGSVTDDLEEDSPSVVKRVGLMEDDTF